MPSRRDGISGLYLKGFNIHGGRLLAYSSNVRNLIKIQVVLPRLPLPAARGYHTHRFIIGLQHVWICYVCIGTGSVTNIQQY